MSGVAWHYVLKFIITGIISSSDNIHFESLDLHLTGDAAVGKSSLLVRLTDRRFLANPDPTVRIAPL